MSDKGWLLIGGIVFFLWWRNQVTASSVPGSDASSTPAAVASTSGSIGYTQGGSAPVETVNIVPSAGNSGTFIAQPILSTPSQIVAAPGIVLSGSPVHNNIRWAVPIAVNSLSQ